LLLLAGSFASRLAPAAATTQQPKSRAHTSRKSSSTTTSSRKKKTTAARRHAKQAAPVRRQLRPTPERYAEIQRALAKSGYYEGSANGVWGQSSVDALQRFQQDKGLEPTGKIDALSLIKLNLGPNYETGAAPATTSAPTAATTGASATP
jgi:murein L,D-transpeptidase YcbB/YkuD